MPAAWSHSLAPAWIVPTFAEQLGRDDNMSAGKLWSGLLLLLSCFCSRISSCGLSTHVEIGKFWALFVCLSVLETGSPDVALTDLELTT